MQQNVEGLADILALYGHCHYLQDAFDDARLSYERSLNFRQQLSDAHLVLLRLGSIYFEQEKVRNGQELMFSDMLHYQESFFCIDYGGE